MSKGDKVALVISLGPEVKKVAVPKLVGLDEDAAVKLLSDRNLEKGLVKAVENSAPAGQVVEQSVAEGTQVDEKTMIDFTVSLGPPDEPSPSASAEVSPSAGPSASPSTSPSPSQMISAAKTITLPGGEGSTHVEVYCGGIRIYNNVVSNSDGTVSVSVMGFAGDLVEIYFDGGLQETYVLQ